MIAVRGQGWLSDNIVKAENGDENTPSHVGLLIAVDPFPIVIEALSRVRTRTLATCVRGAKKAWIISDLRITCADRAAIVRAALSFTADSYGYWDLGLQLGNAVCHTTWWTDHLGWGLKYTPICSYVVAESYDQGANQRFGQDDRTTTPADVMNYARTHPGQFSVAEL